MMQNIEEQQLIQEQITKIRLHAENKKLRTKEIHDCLSVIKDNAYRINIYSEDTVKFEMSFNIPMALVQKIFKANGYTYKTKDKNKNLATAVCALIDALDVIIEEQLKLKI